MPLCHLSTSLPRAEVDESFAKELSKCIATIIDSEEKAVTVHISPDQIIVKSGSTDPMIHMSINAFSPRFFEDEMKLKMVTSLTEFFSEKLGIIDLGKIMLTFHPIEASNVGLSGKLMK